MLARTLATVFFSLLMASSHAASNVISLKEHYPQKYVVKEGDTIYEIAARYLSKPWQWRKIWRDNPHIKNPKRLYPGTVLKLVYHDGKPYLTVSRYGTYKLSPHARPRPAQKAVPPIHLTDIKPFLNRSRVLDSNELATAGYVIEYKGQHLRGSQDEQIYVKDLVARGKNTLSYSIYRPQGMYLAPNSKNKVIGYKALFVGDAQLIKSGNPSTLELTEITQGIKITDRVIPNEKPAFDLYFEPKAPDSKVYGQIIDVLGGLDQVANDQVIVLDKGKMQKLEAGDVIAIYLHQRFAKDPFNKEQVVALPKERIGEAMIFRTFRHTAFALVVNAHRSIKIGDSYTNP